MVRSFLAFAALCTLVLTTGCFSERLAPPTFRYQCQSDASCSLGERCLSNLCQLPCTQATFGDDCTRDHAACFNGACASVCDLSDPTCPSPQTCVDFGIDAGDLGSFGLCGSTCTAQSCPADEICIEGFCLATCDPTDPFGCATGTTCVAGFCVPGEPGPPPATTDETTSGSDTEAEGSESGAGPGGTSAGASG